MPGRPERPQLPAGVTTRRADVGDVDDVARLRASMFESMGAAEETTPEALQRSRDYLVHAIPEGQFCAWLAFADGSAIGSAAAFIMHGPPFADAPDGRAARILNVFVDEAWRSRGIAKALLVDVIDDCVRQGIRRVGLIATDVGAPVYESLGFEPAHEMRRRLDEWVVPSS